MARLIDADKLRHRLLCQPPRNISINFALELVSTMPTVDAEPVVRCKDCRWREETECTRFSDIRPNDDDFCSRGERKEDAETN